MNKHDLLVSMMQRPLSDAPNREYISTDDKDEKKACIDMISYKFMRSFYDQCKELENDVTWDKCVRTMQTSANLLSVAEPVILYTMADFIKKNGFDFTAKPTSLIDIIEPDEPGMKDGQLCAVKLFKDDYGEAIVDLFLFNAEVQFFEYQLEAGKDYTWEQFGEILKKDKSMWTTLQNTFCDAIKRLDFGIGWLAEDLDEVQFLHTSTSE